MKRKKNVSLLLLSLLTCFFISGGIQIMLFSLGKLFGMELLQRMENFIFNPDIFLGEQLYAYWAIYGLLLIPLFIIRYFQESDESSSKERNSVLMYFLMNASLASFVPFILSLVYYMLKYDPVNLHKVLFFSGGAVSVFLKGWIITLPLMIFLQNKETKKDIHFA